MFLDHMPVDSYLLTAKPNLLATHDVWWDSICFKEALFLWGGGKLLSGL